MPAPFVIFVLVLAAAACGQRPSGPALRVIRSFALQGAPSHSLACSPDGKWLASGGEEGDVVVLETATGRIAQRFDASDHWVGAVAFSPDGTRLAAVGRELTLWEVATGEQLGRQPAGSPQALDWSRDGRHLAAVDNHRRVRLFSAKDLATQQRFKLPVRAAVDAVALSPDASKLAVGTRAGRGFVFDTKTGEELDAFRMASWVYGLSWLDDGQLLKLGWRGDYELFGGRKGRVPDKHGYGLVAQRDGKRCVIVTSDAVELHAVEDTKPLRLPGSGAVALDPDGRHWWRAQRGRVHRYLGDKRVASFRLRHRAQPYSCAMSVDGNHIAGTPGGGFVEIFDAATGKSIKRGRLPAPGRAEFVHHVAGPEFVFVLNDSKLRFMDAAARTVREVELKPRPRSLGRGVVRLGRAGKTLLLGDHVHDVTKATSVLTDLDRILARETALSPDGKRIAMLLPVPNSFGGGIGEVVLLDRRGEQLWKRDLNVLPMDVDFRPDGEQVAFATGGGVLVLDASKLENEAEIDRVFQFFRFVGNDYGLGVAGPVFTQSKDWTLELWKVGADSPAATMKLPTWARSLEVSADGKRALLGLADRILLVELVRP